MAQLERNKKGCDFRETRQPFGMLAFRKPDWGGSRILHRMAIQ